MAMKGISATLSLVFLPLRIMARADGGSIDLKGVFHDKKKRSLILEDHISIRVEILDYYSPAALDTSISKITITSRKDSFVVSPRLVPVIRIILKQIIIEQKMNNEEVQRLTNHLILNGSFVDDIGLFYGKMGIAFFLYHYGRYTKEPMYGLLGENLIEDVYENIHENIPATMDKGLCGIAWGICSLLENHFLEGDVNEILADIDTKIMERDPVRITDLSFNTGIGGIWSYAQTRISFAKKTHTPLPFDQRYRNELENSVRMARLPLRVCSPLDVIRVVEIASVINLLKVPLGLDNGCSGVALKHVLK